MGTKNVEENNVVNCKDEKMITTKSPRTQSDLNFVLIFSYNPYMVQKE